MCTLSTGTDTTKQKSSSTRTSRLHKIYSFSSPSHNEDTCHVCKLARMNPVKEKKLNSQVTAERRGENLELCTECLSYKVAGVTHDCKLSQLLSMVQKPTSSQASLPETEVNKGTYLIHDYISLHNKSLNDISFILGLKAGARLR